FAATLNRCYDEIRAIQDDARSSGFKQRPVWPMIILRSSKGWTGPPVVDGQPIAGTFRAHQVPLANVRPGTGPALRAPAPEHLALLEAWLKSYHPEEQFDREGRLVPELRALVPAGARCLSANPIVNGGCVRVDL